MPQVRSGQMKLCDKTNKRLAKNSVKFCKDADRKDKHSDKK